MQVLRTALVTCFIAAVLVSGTVVDVAANGSDMATRPAVPSAGCGTSDVGQVTHERGDLDVEGTERTWRLWTPSAHDGKTPLPLVLWLHELSGSPSGMAPTTHLDKLGEERGFVVAAPQALCEVARWVSSCESAGMALTLADRDNAFIDALIDRLGSELCLDLARVHAAGYASGAYQVTTMSCVLEDRIAAGAVVGGGFDPGDGCELNRPVPLIFFTGINDRYVLYDGGYSDMLLDWLMDDDIPFGEQQGIDSEPHYVPFAQRAEGIAVRNGCEPGATVEVLIDGVVERHSWACPPGAEVEFYPHTGGHQWSLGTTELDTSEMIIDFFEQHPLQE